MKNLFYFIAVVTVAALFTACKPNPEKLIVGTWKTDAMVVENLDEFANQMIQMFLPTVEEQLKQVEEQLATAKPEEKEALEAQKKSLLEQKDKLTIDAFKAEMSKEFDKSKGETMAINADKTIEMNQGEQPVKGTWTLSADGKTLNVKTEGQEQALNIIELSDKKLVLGYEDNKTEMKLKVKISMVK